jgi:RNA polymerase sigma factor (sigma-70 family)
MTVIIKLEDIRLSRVQQQLVVSNIRLVDFVARNFRGYVGKKGVEYEDLQSIGRIGLIRAVARFDPDSDNKFSSLAIPFIKGEIQHYLRDKTDVIKTPRDKESLKIDSLDRCISSESSTSLAELIPSDRVNEIQEPKIDEDLLRAIETLSREDRDILVMTQVNNCTNKVVTEWLKRRPMHVTRRLQVAIEHVKSVLADVTRKLPKVKLGRNALPFTIDGLVNYPDKYRCVVCDGIFGLRSKRGKTQLPQTCSSICASTLAIEKTSNRSPVWKKQELDFCDNLVGKRNLEDIYFELLTYNRVHNLPLRSKDSVKVKLTRLYKSLKVTDTDGDLSTRELARQLNIPVDRVRVWLKNGLKTTKTSAGINKITREALTNFARKNHYRFYGIESDRLSKLITDDKVLKKCLKAPPHIKRIEVKRTDTGKKYRSLRAAAKATGISKSHVASTGWIDRMVLFQYFGLLDTVSHRQ